MKIVYYKTFGTTEFSVFYTKNQKLISPWHDISYKNKDSTFNVIIEIPKWK